MRILLILQCVYSFNLGNSRHELQLSREIINEVPSLKYKFDLSEVTELTHIYETLKKKIDYLPLVEHEMIKTSLALAYISHMTQNYNLGERFIEHPVAVAKILANSCVDCEIIISALLHDVVENTLVTLNNIHIIFGHDVHRIVKGFSKISRLEKKIEQNQKTKDNKNLENDKLRLIYMSEDWRVIQVKLAEKLHNIRTMSQEPIFKQKKLATDALEIYVPLAHRLGMHTIKHEMEDLSFGYLRPYEYDKTLTAMKQRGEYHTENFLYYSIQSIEELLVDFKENYRMESRIKSVYSTWIKVQNRGDIRNIMDLVALRIIIDDGDNSSEIAFEFLERIHSIWDHIPRSFKDYINNPKENGYQSLHTTILIHNKPLEIQIRTSSMHKMAEFGKASHVTYKESRLVPWMKNVLR